MKSSILLLLYIISSNSFAFTDVLSLQEIRTIKKQVNRKLPNKRQYYSQLANCSDKGNTHCSAILGHSYYHSKRYKLASPYLVKSQGIFNIDNQNTH